MPLTPAAIPAIPDHQFKTVRFVMKDGTKSVVVLVSNAALEDMRTRDQHRRSLPPVQTVS